MPILSARPAPIPEPVAVARLPAIESAAVERLKALADPARLTMLVMLAAHPEPLCVCHLNETVALEQPTVSHHLRVLREAGLVVGERRASWVYYQLHPATASWVRLVLATLTT